MFSKLHRTIKRTHNIAFGAQLALQTTEGKRRRFSDPAGIQHPKNPGTKVPNKGPAPQRETRRYMEVGLVASFP